VREVRSSVIGSSAGGTAGDEIGPSNVKELDGLEWVVHPVYMVDL
jgi:hypothetical protein